MQGVNLAKITVSVRILESGLKTYHPRKKLRQTQPKKALLVWAKNHVQLTSKPWERVRIIYLAIQFNYSA